MKLRIGYGIDFHQLVEGRDLVIGGVTIPHHKGALGHSDADVLLHAICDALLGAACLGDIGVHFPDTSSEFKNIDSIELNNVLIKMKKFVENNGIVIFSNSKSLNDKLIIKDMSSKFYSIIIKHDLIIISKNKLNF
jgi:2-C-methyl-D-erythritol 2,4-cyclodiphosphate synthase